MKENNINIVIIGQNEGNSINNMLTSLIKYPYKRIWVCDRCKDDSVHKLNRLKETVIQTDKDLVGRQTSYSRNLGLSFTLNNDVLFLDGDRYLISGDLKQLESSKYDIELLYLENDFRDNRQSKDDYGKVINSFYSCGIFFKRHAIDKIIEFQNELFPTDIQHIWGIEDTYLGDVCYHLGLTTNYNSSIRLNGKFDRVKLDDIDVLEMRFKKRDKLNVLW